MPNCIVGAQRAVFLLLLLLCWSLPTLAHKGHGGTIVKFMQQKVVLQVLMPVGAKALKRKGRLSVGSTTWAEQAWTIDLDNEAHVYYLAYDRGNKKLLGGVLTMTYAYRHGDVRLAVGLDTQQRLTGVVMQGISEKYIPDFEASFGTGLLSEYKGKTVLELAQIAATPAADKPTRFFNSKLAETAALLAAFLHDSH